MPDRDLKKRNVWSKPGGRGSLTPDVRSGGKREGTPPAHLFGRRTSKSALARLFMYVFVIHGVKLQKKYTFFHPGRNPPLFPNYPVCARMPETAEKMDDTMQ